MKFLLAISGGSDSMALWECLRRLPVEYGVIHIQHHLRTSAEQEAQWIEERCAQLEVPFYRYDWTPTKSNIEAEARVFRYRCFEEVLRKEDYTFLCTAHHQDDQVETIIQRLLRGSHLWHCTGMEELRPFADGYLWRPFLSFSKAQLRTFIQRSGVPYFEDESNQSLNYQRNRIRHEVLPKLEAENPKIRQQIIKYATDLRLENRYARHYGEQLYARAKKEQYWDLNEIAKEDEALFQWIWIEKEWIEKGKVWTKAEQQALAHLLASKKGSKKIVVRQTLFYRAYEKLYPPQEAVQILEESPKDAYTLYRNQTLDLGEYALYYGASPVQISGEIISQVQVPFVEDFLYIRHPQAGDRLRLPQGGHKKIQRILIDCKVPQAERSQQWVLCRQEEVLALLGWQWTDLSNCQETGKINYIIYYKKKG